LITKATIINFFEGKCNARDRAIVEKWLSENPGKLKEFFGIEEWENFRPAGALSPDITGKLWKSITENMAPPKARYSKWMAVAASVLAVIGLSWYFILTTRKAGMASAATIANTKRIFNNTAQKMTVTLSDGSIVELLPNSTLSYPVDFNAAKREVVLKGEGNFDIAKDAARPFSVNSNAVLITVLGTRFTVKPDGANNATKVILHEGSVMVRIADSAARGNKNEYYLAPGDIFISRKINRQSRIIDTARVTTPGNDTNDSLSARILHLEKDKDDCYIFNDYPLDVVFDQLQIIYNTKIIYNRSELGNRTFIGKVDKKDSVYNILKSIALLNKYHVQKQGDTLIIAN
jgi:ferric-dicitrate binding protein FerR (iron transport regulator)